MSRLEKFLINFSPSVRRLYRRYKFLHRLRNLSAAPDIYVDSQNSFTIKVHRPIASQIQRNFNNCRGFFSSAYNLKRREFSGRKLVGFSMEEMYSVVSDVENYKEFLPFCKKSHVVLHEDNLLIADLIIGFPPVVEKYTSHVTLIKPNLVAAESKEATLFNHLQTNWKFSPGLSNYPRSCVIHFYVSFEFKSMFYSQLANLFFNELVKQMENAFYTEAIRRYGRPTIDTIRLKLNKSPS